MESWEDNNVHQDKNSLLLIIIALILVGGVVSAVLIFKNKKEVLNVLPATAPVSVILDRKLQEMPVVMGENDDPIDYEEIDKDILPSQLNTLVPDDVSSLFYGKALVDGQDVYRISFFSSDSADKLYQGLLIRVEQVGWEVVSKEFDPALSLVVAQSDEYRLSVSHKLDNNTGEIYMELQARKLQNQI